MRTLRAWIETHKIKTTTTKLQLSPRLALKLCHQVLQFWLLIRETTPSFPVTGLRELEPQAARRSIQNTSALSCTNLLLTRKKRVTNSVPIQKHLKV